MRWLAVDPSLRNTGWTIMDEEKIYRVGLIQTARNKELPQYMDNQICTYHLCHGLSEAMTETKGMGSIKVYSEAKGGSKSAKAAIMMAMAQAIVACCSYENCMTMSLMLPRKVKQIVCGSRSASKGDIANAVTRKYPEAMEMMFNAGLTTKAKREHCLDAIAIGWAINEERKRI